LNSLNSSDYLLLNAEFGYSSNYYGLLIERSWTLIFSAASFVIVVFAEYSALSCLESAELDSFGPSAFMFFLPMNSRWIWSFSCVLRATLSYLLIFSILEFYKFLYSKLLLVLFES